MDSLLQSLASSSPAATSLTPLAVAAHADTSAVATTLTVDVLCRTGSFPLIETLFRECAYSWTEATAITLGYASIGFWLFCQTPQLFTNWRAKTAESLSLSFLFIWLGGDIMNLAGCLLTSQLPFQTYLAAYFVLIDFSLCAQSVWYNLICPPRFPDECVSISSSSAPPSPSYNTLVTPNSTPRMTSSRPQTPSLLVASAPHSRRPSVNTSISGTTATTTGAASGGAGSLFPAKHTVVTLAVLALAACHPTLALPSSSTSSLPNPELITPPPPASSWWPLSSYAIGVAASYCCSFLYLTSRLPQIAHNARRKSVHGLSISMFMFAVGGNTTYALSVVLRSMGQPDPTQFLLASFPFLLGSAGTLVQDAIIFTQWMLWKDKSVDAPSAGDMPTMAAVPTETTPLLLVPPPSQSTSPNAHALRSSSASIVTL